MIISGSSDSEFAVTPMGACVVRAACLRDNCHTSASSGPSRLTVRCSMAVGVYFSCIR